MARKNVADTHAVDFVAIGLNDDHGGYNESVRSRTLDDQHITDMEWDDMGGDVASQFDPASFSGRNFDFSGYGE